MKGKLTRLVEAARQTLSSLNMNPSSYDLVNFMICVTWQFLLIIPRLPWAKQWRGWPWTSWQGRGERRQGDFYRRFEKNYLRQIKLLPFLGFSCNPRSVKMNYFCYIPFVKYVFIYLFPTILRRTAPII